MTDQETIQKVANARPEDLIYYKKDNKGHLKLTVEPQAGTCIACEQPLTEEDIAYAHDIHGEICHNCAEERQYNAYDSKEHKNEKDWDEDLGTNGSANENRTNTTDAYRDLTEEEECEICNEPTCANCNHEEELPEDCKDCPMNLQNKICKDTDGQHQCKYSIRGRGREK